MGTREILKSSHQKRSKKTLQVKYNIQMPLDKKSVPILRYILYISFNSSELWLLVLRFIKKGMILFNISTDYQST